MIPHSRPWMGEEEAEAAARVVRSGMLAQGREVEAFEAECARKLGRQYAVAVSSGTAALHLALRALDLPRNTLIAIPAYACVALPCAVDMAGLASLPVDVDGAGNLRVDAIPTHAGAVILPHLFGKPAAMPPGPAPVIEDVAQSIGNGAGGTGVAAIASFYATKMMTTGEGGMVLTDDAGIAGAVRDLRDYDKRGDGRARFNYKMTDIQAAIGRVQLGRLDGFIARRREIAMRYTEAWRDLPLALPEGEGHAYYRYAVRVEADIPLNPPSKGDSAMPAGDRAAMGPPLDTGQADAPPSLHERAAGLISHLRAAGIDAKAPVHPPGPIPGGLSGAASAYSEIVSIPLYPALSDDEAERIVAAVRAVFA